MPCEGWLRWFFLLDLISKTEGRKLTSMCATHRQEIKWHLTGVGHEPNKNCPKVYNYNTPPPPPQPSHPQQTKKYMYHTHWLCSHLDLHFFAFKISILYRPFHMRSVQILTPAIFVSSPVWLTAARQGCFCERGSHIIHWINGLQSNPELLLHLKVCWKISST